MYIYRTILLFAFVTSPTIALAEKSTSDAFIDAAVRGATDAVFTEAERQIINRYFSDRPYSNNEEYSSGKKHKSKGKKSKGMPPGLAKKKQLPPGLQKQLEKNGTLPPGLAKRNLPHDLQSQLPPVANGMERVIADAHVLLVDKASGVISDIIKDIVR